MKSTRSIESGIYTFDTSNMFKNIVMIEILQNTVFGMCFYTIVIVLLSDADD